MFSSRKTILILVLLVTLPILVYWPGLSGGFLFDDFHSIVLNEGILLKNFTIDALSKSALSGFQIGLFGRPISMLSFGINYYFFGLDTFYFKLINILIHVLNGVGAYFLVSVFIKQSNGIRFDKKATTTLAAIVALIWVIHPIGLSSILYIVQRMTLLAAFFTIYGLLLYCYFRQLEVVGKARLFGYLLVLACCALGAVLSKENGALFPLFVLVIEFFLFRFRFNTVGQKRFVFSFLCVFLLFPACLALLYLSIFSVPYSIFSAYDWRGFSLIERLLTESRVLFSYLQWIIFPHVQGMTFFHDGYEVSRSLVYPVTTLFSILALIGVIVGSFVLRNKNNIVSFGVFWFLTAHLMESTILPLELVFEHRNYMASLGIILALIVLLVQFLRSMNRIKLGSVLVLIAIVFLSVTTATRASLWGNQYALLSSEVKYNPSSSRAYYELGRWYILYSDVSQTENKAKITELFEKATVASESFIDALAGLIHFNEENKDADEQVDLWGKQIVERVKLSEFSANNPNVLVRLIQCKVKHPDTCRIKNELIEEIYNAALSNEYIPADVKAILLSSYSRYFFIVKKRREFGIQMMMKASDMAYDNTEFQLQLTDMLLFMNRVDEAKKRLEAVEKEDTLGRHSIAVEKLKINMATVIAATQNSEN